jgi:type IV fimbrial biogenesis protein FimT
VRHLTEAGLTLIELMVGIAIAALLALSAGPFFADYSANSRLRESGHLLYAEALAAQSEAIKRNGTVRLSTNGNTVQVIDQAPTTPVVLRERVFATGITAAVSTLDFGAEGLPTPFGTAGSINITMSGVTCSSDYRCPGLRVDAGGAIRLCNDTTATC